ncbi:restriction endonuclease subunit S [Bifidobacterium pseudolongum]|uniref:restriction endonuclease subunit S n=1 Tax=Bifidobacterium pseudolongum TaxID=1694 RepID=UPI001A91D039|nr:restriction endonuclease subunit S [Bifidobacterium pseudolongum]
MSDYITDGKGRNTMDKKIQPKLRFRGFTDAWEQRKGAEVICVRRDTIANPPKDIVDVELENLIEGGGLQGDLSLRTASTSVFHEHDTLFGRLRPYLRKFWFANTSGVKSGEIWSLYSSTLKPEFLYALTQSAQFLNQALQTAGTKMPRAEWKTIVEAYFAVPQAEEQEKIGILFQKLEQLIDAEKRKLHLLQERKRSLLKGIFNRTIRFEGFTGVWKQQKLKDEAISISAGGDIDREKLLPSGRYPVIGNALSNNGIIGYYANDYEVKGPAVTVTGRGEVGVAKAREMNFTPVVRLLAIKSLHDSHFLECAINLHRAPLESTGVPQLTIPIISNYKLLFPPTLMEEMSIGLLFKHIDSLIAAVFLKIELLNLKKQSLLQQMFV